MAKTSKLYRNMRLFGLPYQFTALVDPRVEEVTGEIGRKYAENIMLDAPVITIIPGEPSFLPGTKKKQTITQNIINAGSDGWESLKGIIDSELNTKNAYRYYDFKRAYTEYMKYVNILCRTCATFLELENYGMSVNGSVKPFTQYDWRNYRWNTRETLDSGTINKIVNNMRSDEDTWAFLMSTMEDTVTSMYSEEENDYDDEIDTSNGDNTNTTVENTDTDDSISTKGYLDSSSNTYYDMNGIHYDSNGNLLGNDLSEEQLRIKSDSSTYHEVDLPFEVYDENISFEDEEEVINVVGVNRSANTLSSIYSIEGNEERENAVSLYITDAIMTSRGVKKDRAPTDHGVRVVDENGQHTMVNNNEFQYGTTSSTEENTFTDTVLEYAESLLSNFNFVQFYIDPNSSDSENLSNEAGDSMLKGIFDSGSNMFKEMGFILNSGGIGTANSETMSKLQDFTSGAMQSLSDHLSGNALTGVLGRILSLSGNVVRGDNVIFPRVYQNSDYSKSYTFTVHLKSPYGNRLAYFLDICVPLMHLLALGIPRQSSANTYGSPFLVKAYVEGVFTCNMGLVTNMTITRGANDSSMTMDGLPTEVDVSITLEDLYSELTMTPQSSPLLFINNTSLIEYLAVTCGISLITPNLTKKAELVVTGLLNSVKDIPKNIISSAQEAIQNAVMQWDVLKLGS